MCPILNKTWVLSDLQVIASHFYTLQSEPIFGIGVAFNIFRYFWEDVFLWAVALLINIFLCLYFML